MRVNFGQLYTANDAFVFSSKVAPGGLIFGILLGHPSVLLEILEPRTFREKDIFHPRSPRYGSVAARLKEIFILPPHALTSVGGLGLKE